MLSAEGSAAEQLGVLEPTAPGPQDSIRCAAKGDNSNRQGSSGGVSALKRIPTPSLCHFFLPGYLCLYNCSGGTTVTCSKKFILLLKESPPPRKTKHLKADHQLTAQLRNTLLLCHIEGFPKAIIYLHCKVLQFTESTSNQYFMPECIQAVGTYCPKTSSPTFI